MNFLLETEVLVIAVVWLCSTVEDLKTLAIEPSREGPPGSTERLAPCPPSAVFARLLAGDFCTQPPPFTYAIRSVLPDGHGGSRRGELSSGSGVQSAACGKYHRAHKFVATCAHCIWPTAELACIMQLPEHPNHVYDRNPSITTSPAEHLGRMA